MEIYISAFQASFSRFELRCAVSPPVDLHPYIHMTCLHMHVGMRAVVFRFNSHRPGRLKVAIHGYIQIQLFCTEFSSRTYLYVFSALDNSAADGNLQVDQIVVNNIASCSRMPVTGMTTAISHDERSIVIAQLLRHNPGPLNRCLGVI